MLTSVDSDVTKENCAVVIPNREISIKSITGDKISYTKNNGKKWHFSVKGDGLYIPEGKYLFLCDFYKKESAGNTEYTYRVNDLKVTGYMEPGKTYYLKYHLERLEDKKFRVSLSFDN
jgi:hypothetical protein